jgi:hypothetical protein
MTGCVAQSYAAVWRRSAAFWFESRKTRRSPPTARDPALHAASLRTLRLCEKSCFLHSVLSWLVVKFALRNWIIAVVCCGMLVPVVSTTDDLVLLSTAVEQISSGGPNEVRGRLATAPDDSSVAFWVQFEHMDCPGLPMTLPEISRAGGITRVELALVSIYTPKCSVRGPPLAVIA